jgi:ribbon-helix-helix protein
MSRRFNITLTDLQYEWLTEESRQTSVPVAELIRRAIDDKFPPRLERRLRTHELSVRLQRRSLVGRRAGVPF